MTTKNFKVKNGIDIGESVTITAAGAVTGVTTITGATTVDTTNIEATNIKALDGTAAISIADSTGVVSVSTELTVDNINISGNTIISTDTNGNITLIPNGTGDVILSSDNVQIGDANATATLTTNGTGDLVLNTNAGTNAGNITLANGVNGNITVTTNGTGDIQLTTANGGNVVASRNYVKGAIRDATADTNGVVWYLNTSSLTAPYSGLSLDNSASTATQIATVMRNYTGNNTGASIGNRARLVFEKARNTVASPAAVAVNDLLGEVAATGYTSTGWINDQYTFVPGFFGFTAAENWVANTNVGTAFNVTLAPTATTVTSNANLISCIAMNPQVATFRTDAYNFRTKAGTTSAGDYLSLATTGAVIKNGSNIELANFATGTATVSADTIVLQKSNGTDILSLDNDNASLTTTRLRQVVAGGNTTYGGEISLKAGIRGGVTAFDRATELSVTAITTDGTSNATYETKTQRYDGTNYAATVTNDILGRFTFLGNYGTSTTPLSVNAAGAIQVIAAENFTATASGTKLRLSVNKLTTNTQLDALELSSTESTYRSDSVQFKDSDNADLPGGEIHYRRTHGCFHKMANITAAVADTVYNFDWYTDTTVHVGNQGVTVTSGDPTRLNIDAAGDYLVTLEMQAKNTDNQNRFAWIWLAKNGTDLAETAIQVKLQKENEQVINKQWLAEGVTAGQYLEVRFAVDNISGVSLQTVASQASPFVRPAVPSATITITPVGA